MAARLLDVESFGLFTLVLLSNVLLSGGARVLVAEPLLLHPEEVEERSGQALGSALAVGAIAAVLAGTAGLVAPDGRIGTALIVLAGSLPLLVVQDTGRYLALAVSRPVRALQLDLVWLVLTVVGVVVLAHFGYGHLWAFVAVWTGSGALSGFLAIAQVGHLSLRGSRTWLAVTWPFAWRNFLSYTAGQGSALGMSLVITSIAGARATAGVQGALLLQRAFVVFQVAAMASSTVEIARMPGETSARHLAAMRVTAITTVFAVINGLVIVLLPDVLGRAVLGPTWSEAGLLVLPAALQMVAMGAMSGARAGLLGERRIRAAIWVDLSKTAIILGSATVGVFVGGAPGAMWAIGAGHTFGTLLWWLAYRWRADEGARERA